MCGRFLISAEPSSIATQFGLASVPALHPRYNVAPTQDAPVIRADGGRGSARRIDLLRWGLVPHWADSPSIGSRMINARSETAHEKPSFRVPLRRHRCLVATDGFYEWQQLESGKQPWCIRARDNGVFAFGGLYSSWTGEDGELVTFTILTTTPNEVLAPIHDRMPVIIDPSNYEAWLDPGNEDLQALQPMFQPFPAEALHAVPISRHVNRPANDDPACLEPMSLD